MRFLTADVSVGGSENRTQSYNDGGSCGATYGMNIEGTNVRILLAVKDSMGTWAAISVKEPSSLDHKQYSIYLHVLLINPTPDTINTHHAQLQKVDLISLTPVCYPSSGTALTSLMGLEN